MLKWNTLQIAVLLGFAAVAFVRLVVKEMRRRENCLKLRRESQQAATDLAELQRKQIEQTPRGARGMLEAAYLSKSLNRPIRPYWSAKGMFRK
jgi:Tfp pilus assembly protein PilN